MTEEKETFKITLNKKFYKDDLLKDHVEQRRLRVITEPIQKYNKWYHKLLNKLTFGYRFISGWQYLVKSEPIRIKHGLWN